MLFDRSEFLAETAIRAPDLVYELELSGRVRRQKTAAETLQDLRLGADDADQRLWLRRYHQTELMRIGLRDILGLADFEQNLLELSALADACLQYALEVVMRQAKFKKPPLSIVGLGKLGGREINYGSDLDIVFVTDADPKNLPQLQRLAVEFLDLLGGKTELGAVFRLDPRLRPDGEKGLLVNTLEAYEDYYRERAGLWEIQALTRVRPIAGNADAGAQFQKLAAAVADFSPKNAAAGFPLEKKTGLAAWTPGWKKEIDAMRERIVRERTPPGKDRLAIKTGVGGLMDAEFLAQAFCLDRGWQEANTLGALQRGGEAGLLGGVTPGRWRRTMGNCAGLKASSGAGATKAKFCCPTTNRPSIAWRCAAVSPAARILCGRWTAMRAAIRAVYVKYFSGGEALNCEWVNAKFEYRKQIIMPIYEYELCDGDCVVCGGKFTLRRPLDAPELKVCPPAAARCANSSRPSIRRSNSSPCPFPTPRRRASPSLNALARANTKSSKLLSVPARSFQTVLRRLAQRRRVRRDGTDNVWRFGIISAARHFLPECNVRR